MMAHTFNGPLGPNASMFMSPSEHAAYNYEPNDSEATPQHNSEAMTILTTRPKSIKAVARFRVAFTPQPNRSEVEDVLLTPSHPLWRTRVTKAAALFFNLSAKNRHMLWLQQQLGLMKPKPWLAQHSPRQPSRWAIASDPRNVTGKANKRPKHLTRQPSLPFRPKTREEILHSGLRGYDRAAVRSRSTSPRAARIQFPKLAKEQTFQEDLLRVSPRTVSPVDRLCLGLPSFPSNPAVIDDADDHDDTVVLPHRPTTQQGPRAARLPLSHHRQRLSRLIIPEDGNQHDEGLARSDFPRRPVTTGHVTRRPRLGVPPLQLPTSSDTFETPSLMAPTSTPSPRPPLHSPRRPKQDPVVAQLLQQLEPLLATPHTSSLLTAQARVQWKINKAKEEEDILSLLSQLAERLQYNSSNATTGGISPRVRDNMEQMGFRSRDEILRLIELAASRREYRHQLAKELREWREYQQETRLELGLYHKEARREHRETLETTCAWLSIIPVIRGLQLCASRIINVRRRFYFDLAAVKIQRVWRGHLKRRWFLQFLRRKVGMRRAVFRFKLYLRIRQKREAVNCLARFLWDLNGVNAHSLRTRFKRITLKVRMVQSAVRRYLAVMAARVELLTLKWEQTRLRILRGTQRMAPTTKWTFLRSVLVLGLGRLRRRQALEAEENIRSRLRKRYKTTMDIEDGEEKKESEEQFWRNARRRSSVLARLRMGLEFLQEQHTSPKDNGTGGASHGPQGVRKLFHPERRRSDTSLAAVIQGVRAFLRQKSLLVHRKAGRRSSLPEAKNLSAMEPDATFVRKKKGKQKKKKGVNAGATTGLQHTATKAAGGKGHKTVRLVPPPSPLVTPKPSPRPKRGGGKGKTKGVAKPRTATTPRRRGSKAAGLLKKKSFAFKKAGITDALGGAASSAEGPHALPSSSLSPTTAAAAAKSLTADAKGNGASQQPVAGAASGHHPLLATQGTPTRSFWKQAQGSSKGLPRTRTFIKSPGQTEPVSSTNMKASPRPFPPSLKRITRIHAEYLRPRLFRQAMKEAAAKANKDGHHILSADISVSLMQRVLREYLVTCLVDHVHNNLLAYYKHLEASAEAAAAPAGSAAPSSPPPSPSSSSASPSPTGRSPSPTRKLGTPEPKVAKDTDLMLLSSDSRLSEDLGLSSPSPRPSTASFIDASSQPSAGPAMFRLLRQQSSSLRPKSSGSDRILRRHRRQTQAPPSDWNAPFLLLHRTPDATMRHLMNKAVYLSERNWETYED